MEIFLHPKSGEPVEFITTEAVDAKTLNVFKRQLDIALGANGIKGEKAELDY